MNDGIKPERPHNCISSRSRFKELRLDGTFPEKVPNGTVSSTRFGKLAKISGIVPFRLLPLSLIRKTPPELLIQVMPYHALEHGLPVRQLVLVVHAGPLSAL